MTLQSAGLASRFASLADVAESILGRIATLFRRPRGLNVLVVALILLSLLLRLPLVFQADDVPSGHNDANTYFNQVYAFYLDGYVYPDPTRGSGWSLLLWGVLSWFGVEAGQGVAKHAPLDADQAQAALIAYALSATVTVGIVSATYLLARQVLPPLATAGALVLVTFDPYLMSLSTSAMSEPPYIVVFVLALATVLKARDHPAWLLATGGLMAIGHVLRINGLVMFVMALLWAGLLLTRVPLRRRLAWMGASLVVFLLVLSPYLAWRAHHLPGPLDYGTNQRFWADDLWAMDDDYWSEWTMKGGARKETMADYFANHTLTDAIVRLYLSVQWQVFDFVGVGKWPQHQTEGGIWPGTPPDGAALTPLLVVLLAASWAGIGRRRETWFLPLALAFTFATFVWIYPLVRSVRYFSPLIPLVAVFGMAGWVRLCSHLRRPLLASALVLAGYVLLYGASSLAWVPWGLVKAAASPPVLVLSLVATALWVILALLPAMGARLQAARSRHAGGASLARKGP